MRKGTLWLAAAAVALAVAWPAGAAPEATYAIKLARPQAVGSRYPVAVKGRQHKKERVSMAGRVVTDTDTTMDVEVDAIAEVLAVDGKQQGIRMAYTIERAQKTEKAQTTELLARGRVVVVEHKGGRATYTVDGERAPRNIEEALGVVISAHEPNAATDDEIFGTRDRKKIGDEWGINAEAAAKDFTSKGVKIEPQNIQGSTKLVAAKSRDGVKVVELTGKLSISQITLPLPAGAQVEKSFVEALFWGLFPQDTKAPRRVTESMMLKTGFRVRMQKPDSGEEVVVEALVEQGHEAKFGAIK
jgi:hypothetical protein